MEFGIAGSPGWHETGGLISVLGLGLAYPSGMLVDRFGRKGVIVPATLISGLALLLFSRASSYSWFLWGCAAWAVAWTVAISTGEEWKARIEQTCTTTPPTRSQIQRRSWIATV